jgi:hypothetical protein
VDTLWQIKQIDRPELDFWAGGSKKVLKRKKMTPNSIFPPFPISVFPRRGRDSNS